MLRSLIDKNPEMLSKNVLLAVLDMVHAVYAVVLVVDMVDFFKVVAVVILVWKWKAKRENFLCYFRCCVCLKPLPFNISTLYSHGFLHVYLHASVH